MLVFINFPSFPWYEIIYFQNSKRYFGNMKTKIVNYFQKYDMCSLLQNMVIVPHAEAINFLQKIK